MLLAGAPVTWAQSERPTTEDLLPENAVAYLQVHNIRGMFEDMQRTNFGRMLADEKVAPLAQDLYSQAREAYEEYAQEQVGLTWDDLQNLPTGEICFAVIAPRRADLQYVLFFDIDPELGAADRVLNRTKEATEDFGGMIEEDSIEDVTLTSIIPPGGNVKFTHFQKGNTIVVSTDRKLSEQILQRWDGQAVEGTRPLSQNRKFITIMNRCRSTRDLPATMRFFVDPIELAKGATRGDLGAQFVINLLPTLGLDGLLAIGGTSIMDEQEFESVAHVHFLMANPRAGILEMFAFKPADYRPPLWASKDCYNYFSTSLDFQKFYFELSRIVDAIAGEGTMQAQVESNFESELGLDLREDVLAAFSGRMTLVNWMSEPVTANSQTTGFGLGIADEEKAEHLLKTIIERINRDNLEQGEEGPIFEEKHRGITYWVVENEFRRRRFEEQRGGGAGIELREPIPSFAIVGDALLITDSEEFIRHAIETHAGDHMALQDEPQMADVTARLTRLLGTDMPCGVMYSDPRPTLRWVLNLAQSEGAREFLNSDDEYEEPMLRRFKRGLRDNPPPTFEDIEKYIAPSGGFMTSDDTGFHFLIFQLKAGD
ncbi:MAG TPA: hypothetical protein PKD54_10910 [Pirellulaceae bacterium]|nr:hypothetical protein [Pirellulaceae bacterium]